MGSKNERAGMLYGQTSSQIVLLSDPIRFSFIYIAAFIALHPALINSSVMAGVIQLVCFPLLLSICFSLILPVQLL